MKRVFCIALVFLLLTGCSATRDDITVEQIITAYENAGFAVYSGYYEETLEHGQIGYIQADHPDGGYIYFAIYESEAAAKAAKEELYHPGVSGLFSWIFGDPSWNRWEVCGNIVAEYDDPELYEVFKALFNET